MEESLRSNPPDAAIGRRTAIKLVGLVLVSLFGAALLVMRTEWAEQMARSRPRALSKKEPSENDRAIANIVAVLIGAILLVGGIVGIVTTLRH